LCTKALRSRIDPVKKFARTVRNHRELLLNYFRARKEFSSGVIETGVRRVIAALRCDGAGRVGSGVLA